MNNTIIHCKTQEQLNGIEKMFGFSNRGIKKWCNWEERKGKTALRININGKIDSVANINYYMENKGYKDYTFTTAEEVLEKKPKFKVGDKVRIRKDSQYRKQQYGSGIIIQYREDTDYHYRVEWKETSFDEVYRDKDLELVKAKEISLATRIINLLEEGNKVVVKDRDGDCRTFFPKEYKGNDYKFIANWSTNGFNKRDIKSCCKDGYFTEIVEYEPYGIKIKSYLGNHLKRFEGHIAPLPEKYIKQALTYGHLTLIDNFKLNNSSNEQRGHKFMCKAVKLIKRLGLSEADKLLMEYDCKDQQGNWTDNGRRSIVELEVKERGYKSIDAMNNKFFGGKDAIRLDIFNLDDLIKKHEEKLVGIFKDDKARNKKK